MIVEEGRKIRDDLQECRSVLKELTMKESVERIMKYLMNRYKSLAVKKKSLSSTSVSTSTISTLSTISTMPKSESTSTSTSASISTSTSTLISTSTDNVLSRTKKAFEKLYAKEEKYEKSPNDELYSVIH